MTQKSTPNRLKQVYHTHSAEETEALGRELADSLQSQNILLFGELGAGKTTFLRGLAAGLGVTATVKSPTFVYEKVYSATQNDSKVFHHFDLYRLNTVDVEMAEHLKTAFNNPTATVAVEWSERIPKELLPQKRVELYFTEQSDTGRRLNLKEFF